jgi:hypothetical protein
LIFTRYSASCNFLTISKGKKERKKKKGGGEGGGREGGGSSINKLIIR